MIFFTIAGIILFIFINLYCYKALRNNIFVGKFKKNLIIIFVILLCFEILFFLTLANIYINRILFIIVAICLSISILLFIMLLAGNIGYSSVSKFSKSRRHALKLIFDLSVLIGFFTYFFKGLYNANFNIQITPRKISINNLKDDLNIAIITDIHIGEFLQKEFLQKIVNMVNSLKADAVFIVGDIVDLKAENLRDFIEPLNELESKFGTYLVVGNHEYYHGIDELLDKFRSMKLKVLENENVKFGGINLAGVYDISGFKFGKYMPDFNKALSNLDKDLPTVLLTHQPKSLKFFKNDIDLAICGHTHAGQIFPFSILVWLDQKYLYGIYKLNKKMQLLVSSGIGFWGPPIRILSKSEIVHLHLTNKEVV